MTSSTSCELVWLNVSWAYLGIVCLVRKRGAENATLSIADGGKADPSEA